MPQNSSYLMKHAFLVVTKLNALWVRMLRAKYKVVEVCPSTIERAACSYVWRSLGKVWHSFKDGVVWHLGNGRSVDFFHDIWILKLGKLKDHVLPGSTVPTASKVAEFVDEEGSWDWKILSTLFSHDVLNRIRVFYLPRDVFENDSCS